LIFVLFLPGADLIIQTVRQRTLENRSLDIQTVFNMINENSKKGDIIVSPPYYAYLSDRFISAEAVNPKYLTKCALSEKMSKLSSPAMDTLADLTLSIKRGIPKIILLDMNTFGRIDSILKEIKYNYVKIGEVRTINEFLYVYVPRL